MASGKKRGLGKGLSALISGQPSPDVVDKLAPAPAAEAPAPPDGPRLLELDPRDLEPNPMQPRVHFDEEALAELAESIKIDGVQEPVIVRQANGKYELVSGERRVRASIMADLATVPAVCREVSDSDMLKLGIIENIQREDLNPIELAKAYQNLIEEFHWTQEEMADQVGKKRATVANTLRLLNLPDGVQDAVGNGSISMGHARALLALESPQAQMAATRKIISQGLSVRQAEKLASPKAKGKAKSTEKDPNILAIEDELRRRLGTKVALKSSGPAKGKIEIEYFSLDELERLLELFRSTR